MPPPTELDLKPIKARYAACESQHEDIPALVAEAERLRSELAAVRAARQPVYATETTARRHAGEEQARTGMPHDVARLGDGWRVVRMVAQVVQDVGEMS